MNKKIFTGFLTLFLTLLTVSASATDGKIHTSYPILPANQYFEYRGLNSRNVTLNSLLSFNCVLLLQMYYRDPQMAIDNVSLVILVQKSLEGADVALMPEQERINHSIVEIAASLKANGRIQEAKNYLGFNCQCRSIFPSARALCQILDQKKEEILKEKYHYRKVFPGR